MSTYLLGIFASTVILVFTIVVMRRGLIRQRYSIVWVVTSSLMLIFSISSSTLLRITSSLEFTTPSNFLFFIGIVLLLVISVQYSYELGKLEEQNRKMAIEIAMIKNKLNRKGN